MLQRDFLKLLNDHTCLSRPADGLTVCELAIRGERQLFRPLITPWCAVRGRLFKNAGHMWRCSTSFSCLSPILTICTILHAERLKMLRQKHKSHIINAICDLRNPGCHSGAFKKLFRRPGLRPVFPAISPIKTVLMAVTRWKSKKRSLFEASLLLSYVKDNTYAACRQKTICRSHSREAELMQRHKASDVN